VLTKRQITVDNFNEYTPYKLSITSIFIIILAKISYKIKHYDKLVRGSWQDFNSSIYWHIGLTKIL